MRALLDVNVLIALLDSDHASHHSARSWFAEHAGAGWASCAITQNGCIRIMSHPGYPNARSVFEVAQRLRAATSQTVHEFWAESVSVLNPNVVDPSRIHGPRQLTDVYLLALAVSNNARLATFDQSIAIDAAVGATASHLVVL